ncbi:MAG: hypothetical protein A4E51_01767 [Methanosaeta sp. PtaU1.Bin055]|nr:MAG: hypothetical protein A4E51_01767 [Methanosaeta sp. PtaU1.Bin055]
MPLYQSAIRDRFIGYAYDQRLDDPLELRHGHGPAHLAAGEAVDILLPLLFRLMVDGEGMKYRDVKL